MVSTKNKLINQISTINDQNTLEFLSDILNQLNEEGTFDLPDQMKKDIEKSISQIEKGDFETHEQVMKNLLNE